VAGRLRSKLTRIIETTATAGTALVGKGTNMRNVRHPSPGEVLLEEFLVPLGISADRLKSNPAAEDLETFLRRQRAEDLVAVRRESREQHAA
jgi:hypothetical protein